MKRFSIALVFVSMVAATASADDTHNLCFTHPSHAGAAVSIPQDDAIHLNPDGSNKYVYEQWYWNAVLVGDDGHTYGVETIPFQFTFPMLPPINVIQIALTDMHTGEYLNQFVWGGGGYTHVANGFDLSLTDADGSFTATGGSGRDDLELTYSDGSVATVHFEGLKNPTPAWFDGFASLVDPITGTNHGAQFYFNRRNMLATGTIKRPGKREVHAAGVGWYDREFGSVIGTPGSQANNTNWHWLSLHLADGSDYMLWDMYADDTGNSLVHVVNEIGAAPACTEKRITTFSIAGNGPTISNVGPPASVFDSSVHLSIPEENLELDIKLARDNQVITSGGLFSPFVEGIMTATGKKNGRPVAGTGYLEQFSREGGCCQGL